MSSVHTVLIGSSGTGTGFAAAMALRRTWSGRVRIVAMDINPGHLVTTSLLSDVFYQVPPSASFDFGLKLLSIIDSEGVDTYLPLLPEEIILAARLVDEGKISKVIVLAPTVKSASICGDKYAMSGFLSSQGILVPRTALAGQPFPDSEYFLKPRRSFGSRGARRVTREELASSGISELESWIVQEVCAPPEVTVDSFVDPSSGYSHSVCRERIETKAGVCTKCRLFMDDELMGYARRIASSLGLSGSFCFQVMRSPSGWVVTDLNPRPGAGTAMSAASGNDFFGAAFALSWGEDVRRFFRPLPAPLYVTRQYAEFVMGSGE